MTKFSGRGFFYLFLGAFMYNFHVITAVSEYKAVEMEMVGAEISFNFHGNMKCPHLKGGGVRKRDTAI